MSAPSSVPHAAVSDASRGSRSASATHGERVIGDHAGVGGTTGPTAGLGPGAEAEARSSAGGREGDDGAKTAGEDAQALMASANTSIVPRARRTTTTLARALPRLKEKRGKRSEGRLTLQCSAILLGLAGELLQRVLPPEREAHAEPEEKARAYGQADEERGHPVRVRSPRLYAARLTLS